MRVEVEAVTELRFDDRTPVRSASAVARLADGWLVAQDDATHGAWWRGDAVVRVRLLPPADGHETFDAASGTKHLKPDLEAACALAADQVLLLGSGSTPSRMRAVLARADGDTVHAQVRDLTSLYAATAGALGVADDQLNLEGACILGDTLRWWHRGLPSAGLPTASIDIPLAPLLAGDLATPGRVRLHDLGSVEGVGLGVTDAVSLAPDSVLVSAAAEDTPNTYDDGPVVASVLALLTEGSAPLVGRLPDVRGAVAKVEGLALVDASPGSATLLATVDADDPGAPSLALRLFASW
ncbi:hypothetical protein DDE18_08700 [Nocardioides gansuensis]|uniref:Uncharacterized protein n=1 Tax=Nocardioides gansuensis TaxID=2138300 RepID=A0A2T8FCD2_9ACTN|nr:hypothetical protein [Nocardioides gansuensis]PVG83362.1 hypothetical protein DDE18_08700 [Nocardioides gansuensis]